MQIAGDAGEHQVRGSQYGAGPWADRLCAQENIVFVLGGE